MVCKITKLGTIVCSSSWGIGTCHYIDPETGVREVVYGYPCSDNPHDFEPDADSCTPAEIAAHEAALLAWKG